MPTDHSQDLEAQIRRGISRLNAAAGANLEDASGERSRQLAQYLLLLAKWNKSFGLTAVRDPKDMVAKHVLDSLAVAPWLTGDRIVDVGTGPGLPGIPLAVFEPERQFFLLDSREKRVQFVRQACFQIGVQNVVAIAGRVESYRPEIKFDTLVARAFASLEQLRLCTRTLCRSGTRLVAMKGRLPQDEIDELPTAVRQSLLVSKLSVPDLAAERHVVVFNV